ESDQGIDSRLPFPIAERNFYEAARYGLAAELDWFGGTRVVLRELVLENLLAQAARGLERAGVEKAEAERYLGVIEQRVSSGRTGAAWQQAWVQRHGRDFAGLVEAYLANQESGTAVHDWSL